MTIVSLVIILSIILFFITLKIIFHRKSYDIKRDNIYGMIKINGTPVEYSDLNHYITTQKHYPRDIVLGPIVDIETDLGIEIPDVIEYHIDNQNVHESSVQNNIKNTFGKLMKTQQDIDIEAIIAYIDQHENSDKIKSILYRIIDRNANISALKSTESEVVKNVWNNSDSNVKEQLMNSILDCEDINGQLYCPTGVVTRITSALHINNPDNWPKPKNLLNQEIMVLFGKHFSETGDKGLARSRVISDYSGIYTPEIINEIIDEWYDYI